MRFVVAALLSVILTGPVAWADPVTGKEAKRALFKPAPARAEVVAQSVLDDAEAKIAQQVAAQQAYYGAMAVSPEDGLLSEATVAAANYHDVQSARVAALAGCNERRKGAAECVIVADIVPKDYQPVDFQLSAAATEGFYAEYRKARAPKAMAISPSTGKWAVIASDAAATQAVAECAKVAGASDCLVVVQD